MHSSEARMPMAHKSNFSSYRQPFRIYGERQSGVPQKVFLSYYFFTLFTVHPKSHIFTFPQVNKQNNYFVDLNDIDGAKQDSCFSKAHFLDKRRQFRNYMIMRDIDKAQSSTLKKGIDTKRKMNPLMPQLSISRQQGSQPMIENYPLQFTSICHKNFIKGLQGNICGKKTQKINIYYNKEQCLRDRRVKTHIFQKVDVAPHSEQNLPESINKRYKKGSLIRFLINKYLAMSQGCDEISFLNWLKDPAIQQMFQSVESNQGFLKGDETEEFKTIDSSRKTKEKGGRYLILKKILLNNVPKERARNLTREICRKYRVNEKSLCFYFLLLLQVYPQQKRSVESYQAFIKNVHENLMKNQSNNFQDQNRIENKQNQILRLAEATEPFFKGDVRKSIELAFCERTDEGKRRGRKLNMMKQCLQILQTESIQ